MGCEIHFSFSRKEVLFIYLTSVSYFCDVFQVWLRFISNQLICILSLLDILYCPPPLRISLSFSVVC